MCTYSQSLSKLSAEYLYKHTLAVCEYLWIELMT